MNWMMLIAPFPMIVVIVLLVAKIWRLEGSLREVTRKEQLVVEEHHLTCAAELARWSHQLKETRQLALDVFGYCFRLEGIVEELSQALSLPMGDGRLTRYVASAREVTESSPPIMAMVEAIQSEDWEELDRLRHGGTSQNEGV